jgi:hypothetical protein
MPDTFNTQNSQYKPPTPGAIPSPVPLSSQGQSSVSGSIANIGSSISGSFSSTKNQVSGSISNAKDKLNQFKKQLDTIKGKQKELDPFKNLNDPKSFLKQQTLSVSKNQVITVLTPIVSQFIKIEYIAKLLIKKLEKQTREQVKNKGTLTVSGGTFTFTPSNPGDYSIFKSNFDRKVANLKTTVQKLQQVITILNNILRIINIALSIIQLYIKLKLVQLGVQLTSVTADLASPSPAKTSGVLLSNITISIIKLGDAKVKVEKYKAGITIAKSILSILKKALTDIKIKLDQLQFIIVSSPSNEGIPGVSDSTSLSLIESINDVQTTAPENEEYTDAVGKSYILELVTLPNGAIQYQALDSYSKFKITQTAPSKIKNPQQLLEEIKQILG